MKLSKILCLILPLLQCAALPAEEKLYISHSDALGCHTSIKLDVGETVNVKAIYGDEYGVYLYQSEITSENTPTHVEMTHKYLAPINSFNHALDERAFMLEAKLVYYPCERCNQWRAIGYNCSNRDCPSNIN